MTSRKALLIVAIRHFVSVPAQDERIIDTLFETDRPERGDFFLRAGKQYWLIVTCG